MEISRTAAGFVWGIVATVAMSVLMAIGFTTGVAPMPEPIPMAIVGSFVAGLPEPALVVLTVGAHLAYGGLWGAILAAVIRPVTPGKGLGFGVLLWILMGVAFLPFLGWGLFGTGITPAIAGATLILHLVYGGTLGWTLEHESGTGVSLPTPTTNP